VCINAAADAPADSSGDTVEPRARVDDHYPAAFAANAGVDTAAGLTNVRRPMVRNETPASAQSPPAIQNATL
jgi:hypothetical protein